MHFVKCTLDCRSPHGKTMHMPIDENQDPARKRRYPVADNVCIQVLDLLEDGCEGLLQHIKEHDLSAAQPV